MNRITQPSCPRANPTIPGHVFAGGNLNNLGPNGTYQFHALWIIRERDPVTGLWETAEDYSDLAAGFGEASCSDIKVALNGDVYAAGGGAYTGWIVRRRAAQAPLFSPFTTVDTVPACSGAMAMTVDPDLGGRGEWASGTAKGTAISPSGTIYVAGTLFNNSTGKNHWVVRSSMDGGATWSISDNLAPNAADADALGIAVAANKTVYVCGRVQGSNGYHWVVRQGTPTTKLVKQGKNWVTVTTVVWSTIRDDQIVTGKNARANGTTVDLFGNVFVSGNGLVDDSGVSRFIVRRLLVP